MTRWLYLCSDLGIPIDGAKGASEHVRAITRALCAAGQDVVVLAARGDLPGDHPAQQVRHTLGADARNRANMLHHWLKANDGPAAMATELAQMSYDAVLANELEGEAFALDVDIVVERLSLFSTAGRSFARKRGIPYLVEMNAPIAREAARFRAASLESLARSVEHKTLSDADCVMTVSNELRRYAIDELGLDPARVVTVPNGVELDLFGRTYDAAAARREAGVPPNAVVFGFVGSLKVWHGIEVLLDAFAIVQQKVPAAHLLVIGEGRRLEHYKAQTHAMGISSGVTFFGGTDHATVARLLSAVDVAVAPYFSQGDFYFSPLKLYEYMAAGVCVIASRAGQIAEVVEEGHNGLTVEPGDAASLADKMLRVALDAGLRARLGGVAQRSVAHCGWDATAQRIVELASDVFRQRARSPKEVAHAVV